MTILNPRRAPPPGSDNVDNIVEVNLAADFTTSSTTFVDVTNLTAGITTTGGSVQISGVLAGFANSNPMDFYINILRDAVVVAGYRTSIPGDNYKMVPILAIDTPSAGSYTYKVQVKCSASTYLSNCSSNAISAEQSLILTELHD